MVTNILNQVTYHTEQPKVSSQLKSMRPGGLGHETKTTLSPCKGDTIYIPSLVTGNKLTFPSLVLGNLLVNYCLYGMQPNGTKRNSITQVPTT